MSTSLTSQEGQLASTMVNLCNPGTKFNFSWCCVLQSFFFISQDKCVWYFLTWTITGDSNPNISRPSTDPGGCSVGRLALPMLSCFRISIFSLSQTMLQHLVGETLIKTSPGQFSTVTCKWTDRYKHTEEQVRRWYRKTETYHKQRSLQSSV